jgi:hypothetical protein
MIIEGSGSISLTNGSGCGSGRPKNIWILRIRNTTQSFYCRHDRPLINLTSSYMDHLGRVKDREQVESVYSWYDDDECRLYNFNFFTLQIVPLTKFRLQLTIEIFIRTACTKACLPCASVMFVLRKKRVSNRGMEGVGECRGLTRAISIHCIEHLRMLRLSGESNPEPPALKASTLWKEPFERPYLVAIRDLTCAATGVSIFCLISSKNGKSHFLNGVQQFRLMKIKNYCTIER